MTSTPGEERLTQNAWLTYREAEVAGFYSVPIEDVDALFTRLREVEGERDRAKGTLVEWLRNMEAPVIRAFGQERWEAARQEIFSQGNAGWTMILEVAAQGLADELAQAEQRVAGLEKIARASAESFARIAAMDDPIVSAAGCLVAAALVTDALTPPPPAG